SQLPRLHTLALQAAPHASLPVEQFLQRALSSGADAVWILDKTGKAFRGGVICDHAPEDRSAPVCVLPNVLGSQVRVLGSGLELWSAGSKTFLAARIPLAGANGGAAQALVAGFQTSPDFYNRINLIQSQTAEYYSQKQNLRALK